MDFRSDEPEEPGVPLIGESLYGFDIENLPEGFTPTGVLVIVATLDRDGDPALSLRNNISMSAWDMLGMLRAATLTTEQDVLAMWEYTDEASD